MRIAYHLDADGGFRCADLDEGITSYAYPSSTAAICAKRKPLIAARRMLREENRGIERSAYDARNLHILTGCNQPYTVWED